MSDKDPKAEQRKQDHIELAFKSQVSQMDLDTRFYYEPMLSGHPDPLMPFKFLGKTLRSPIWVSSMTGGTEKAGHINKNLAQACKEFGMGMGLGSCRALLDSNQHYGDFNVRSILGDDLPFYANLGIAQLETLMVKDESEKIHELIYKLSADGLFIHVNPLQEWLQPEGDIYKKSPVETISLLLDENPDLKVIVKEVGQGMGIRSLRALMKLPIQAIEFAASGGTNFAKLELIRNSQEQQDQYMELSRLGHSANDMVEMVNSILAESEDNDGLCKTFIVSGGVKNFLDGYYLTQKLNATAVYGQASTLLKYAEQSYESLRQYLNYQLKGYALAETYLRVRQ